jgi:energy-coupling factor transport system substrate-specific component
MTTETPATRGGSGWLRVAVGVVAFLIATAVGIVTVGQFADPNVDPNTGADATAANSFALILAVAMLIGTAVTLVLEKVQTGRVESLSRQFTLRVIALMPLAIAINIVLGQTVAAALKLPVYLDSIGTILVGVLAGPIAGAATGALGNILWAYVVPPPFQYPPAAAFAVVAAVIGIAAGVAGRRGLMRPRPNRPTGELVVAGVLIGGIILLLGWLASVGYQLIFDTALNPLPSTDNQLFLVLGYIAVLLVVAAILGVFALLFGRRDLTAAYAVVTGVVTGIVAALISAPIAAAVFGGVTGAGTDFLVAAFRQAGVDIYAATTGQGLISDPIDKAITFVIVYLITVGMAIRLKARFPQGEQLIEHADVPAPATGASTTEGTG